MKPKKVGGDGDQVPSLPLAGLQKTSLIDFPGKIAAVVFLTGCNFRCPYCHNPELALGRMPEPRPPEIRSIDTLISFLAQRRTLLEGVVISGGEPTLCPHLAELCRAIRRLGLAVKLDTNGSRPEVLAQLIREGLVDFVAMDIKTDPRRYGPPLAGVEDGRRVGRSIHLLLSTSVAHEFRTTCVRPFIDEATLHTIAQVIQGARQYSLQTFSARPLLSPDFWQGETPGYSAQEMQQLQAVVAPYVESCLLR